MLPALEKLNNKMKDEEMIYTSIAVTDEEFIGLDEPTDNYLHRDIRRQLKAKIKDGSLRFSVCLYTYSIGEQYPDLLILLRIPHSYSRRKDPDKFAMDFNSTMETVKQDALAIESKQTLKELVRLFGTFSINKNSNRVKHVVQNIFPGLDFEEVQSILGEDIDEDLVQDLCYYNSRGGKVAGATLFDKFDKFYECCKMILHSNGVTDESCHSSADIIYLNRSTVTSIQDLRNQTNEALKNDVEDGNLEDLPPVPFESSITLQFCPGDPHTCMAAKFTGSLKVSRKLESCTLQAQHVDRHWNNAYTHYHKNWLVDVRNKVGQDEVKFYDQDNKAKIPIGDITPVSAVPGARTRQ